MQSWTAWVKVLNSMGKITWTQQNREPFCPLVQDLPDKLLIFTQTKHPSSQHNDSPYVQKEK